MSRRKSFVHTHFPALFAPSAPHIAGPMSLRRGWSVLLLGLVMGLVMFSSPLVGAASDPKLFIQVKVSRLRVAPQHWAQGLSAVPFGSEVTLLSKEGDWYRVRTVAGEEGFLHSSAVTARTVVFKGRAADFDVRTEPTDVVLAGKGFASQLETAFREGEPGLDYAAIDRLEQRGFDESAFEKFLREGKLRMVEEGARG